MLGGLWHSYTCIRIFREYSWLLNNTGLNCVGQNIYDFLINQHHYTILSLVESLDAEPQIWRVDYGTWACMAFGIPGGRCVFPTVLLRSNWTSFSEVPLAYLFTPCPFGVWTFITVNEWLNTKKKCIQFINDSSHFWEYTICLVVEMSPRGEVLNAAVTL